MSDESFADFERLFREEYPAIVRTAYFLVTDQAAAEEVTQEAFIQLFIHWPKVSSYERPGAWVRRVAIRLATKSLRARRRARRGLTGSAPREDMGSDGSDVRQAVLSLPAMQRAAVVLYYYEDRSITEIAELIGCSDVTARVHLHKARRRLAALLGEETTDVAR